MTNKILNTNKDLLLNHSKDSRQQLNVSDIYNFNRPKGKYGYVSLRKTWENEYQNEINHRSILSNQVDTEIDQQYSLLQIMFDTIDKNLIYDLFRQHKYNVLKTVELLSLITEPCNLSMNHTEKVIEDFHYIQDDEIQSIDDDWEIITPTYHSDPLTYKEIVSNDKNKLEKHKSIQEKSIDLNLVYLNKKHQNKKSSMIDIKQDEYQDISYDLKEIRRNRIKINKLNKKKNRPKFQNI